MLTKYAVESQPYIGVFSVGSEEVTIIPHIDESVFEEALETPVVKTNLGGTRVNGSLMCANSNGGIVSDIVEEREIESILDYFDVTMVDDKLNAIGNNVLVNDHGALIHPNLKKSTENAVADELEVEVKRGTIAGIKMVGSVAVATNKGVLCHPHLEDEEKEKLEEIFEVPVSKGTANHGSGWIGTCMIANSNGAVIGDKTTPIEMGRIEDGLGYLED